jgi:hypothetical protein
MRLLRKRSSALNLPTLRLEGGLFLPDQLEKAALGKCSHQTEADYQTPRGLKLRDDSSRAFQIACAQWKHFAPSLERQDQDANKATIQFVIELLRDAFAWSSAVATSGFTLGQLAYPLTGVLADTVPLVVAPHNVGLDEADTRFAVLGSGARKKSAFQLAQEFLDASDAHLWAIVSNGRQLRLLRDADTLTRPSYLDIDLQDILGNARLTEFEMVWRLLHASRAKVDTAAGAKAKDCIWEKWREEGRQEGTRVRDGLRQGVTLALRLLGGGFLAHPANEALRHDLLDGRLSKEVYFQQLLRLVYRFIFLITVEERGILHGDDQGRAGLTARRAYAEGYALARLREVCVQNRARNQFSDIWQGLQIVFRGLAEGEPRLALPALGGLFAQDQCTLFERALLSNAVLLDVMKQLRWSNRSGTLSPVDYRNMGPEELGSVYESLLELVPDIKVLTREFGFVGLDNDESTQGNARKTSGSYYTPDSLVKELIKSALEPVIEQRLADNPGNPVEALLSIKVVDPACGSGHFLLAAARRLAERLAALRAVDGVVVQQDYRHALREVIGRCIFGVDRNPMALELARTSLWLEGFEEGAALSFLDHHLVCGDALMGLTDLQQLRFGIPDAAFKPLSGDDRTICRELAKENKDSLKTFAKLEHDRQRMLALEESAGLKDLQALEAMPDNTTRQIAAKQTAYDAFLARARESRLALAADLLLGAFLAPKVDDDSKRTTPTSQNLYFELFTQQEASTLTKVHQADRLAHARALCVAAKVLHWPLAFPQVFGKGGFDCVLGNPPWERIKLQEEEFFATRSSLVMAAKNKAERGQRIEWLAQGMLARHLYPELIYSKAEQQAEQGLHAEFISARRTAEAASIFAHVKREDGGRFPLTGVGDVNTYALFAETIGQIRDKSGRAGFIVPTGIATDDSTKAYFGEIVQSGELVSLFDFENREGIFPGVHRSYKFCLITLGQAKAAQFAFFLAQTTQLADERRRFALTADDFARINPNTRTCPIFRTNKDAELTRKIYERVPVLIRDEYDASPERNPWDITFMTMFHMSNDSHLFFDHAAPAHLPLYEAKMIHQFDHRWATYATPNSSRDITLIEKQNPAFSSTPRYWVHIAEVEACLEDPKWNKPWLFGWRDIARTTDERTVIASVLPRVGVGHTMPLFATAESPIMEAVLLANLLALPFDYIARQKIGGTHLTYGYLRQFPVLPPEFYTEPNLDFIVPRVLELTYTTYDLKAWASALNHEGEPFPFDPERRAILRAELDAYYAKLYGLMRDDLRYILDPADVMGDDYPSETFRVLKNNELRAFGEYRTQRLVLEAWDKLERGDNT